LGATLLDKEALHTASEFVSPEDFFKESSCHHFETMREMDSRNEAIDLITLTNALKPEASEKVDGVAYRHPFKIRW